VRIYYFNPTIYDRVQYLSPFLENFIVIHLIKDVFVIPTKIGVQVNGREIKWSKNYYLQKTILLSNCYVV